MENLKEKEVKKKIPWWVGVLIIILIFMALSYSNNLDKECVDRCVYHNYDCIVYEIGFDRYSLADLCSSELEYCVNRC